MTCQGRCNAVRAVAVLVCVMVLVECAAAATITVGGAKSWNLGVDYRTWAAVTRVRPNDSLLFKYDPRMHNVLMVSKADYDACRTTAPWSKRTSGNDSIKFTKSGTYYLICGVGTHCKSGMKVAVNVRW